MALFRYDAAILVSLKSTVDPSVEPMDPQKADRPEGSSELPPLPYIYINNAKDYGDPASMFRATVYLAKVAARLAAQGQDFGDTDKLISSVKAIAKTFQVILKYAVLYDFILM